MPLFTRLGQYTSRALDSLIFSFPSPHTKDNTTEEASMSSSVLQFFGLEQDQHAYRSPSNDPTLGLEPGEMNAIVGGVGPFTFLAGGYGVILVLMAIVLNRIHHLVHQPRRPLHPGAFLQGPRTRMARALTSPHALTLLRAPGVLLLVRSWTLLTIVTLQVAGMYPATSGLYGVERLGDWAAQKEMATVCWQIFLSVCVGLVFGGLGNGLDRGRRRDPGAGFNLFGYSFLLHLYSSPLTHHRQRAATNAPGRPDVHALLQLWLSLTELTALQVMELSPALKQLQMIPTAFCGIFGLSHFVYVLRYAPLKFPSFTFLTHLMALFLGTIIIVTAILKSITHLFTLGYIPSPMLEHILPAHAIPKLSEDFGVALLRLGTACIEATQLSGLRNELASIEESSGPYVDLDAVQSAVHGTKGGGFSTEITDIKTPEEEMGEPDRPRIRETKVFWRAFGRLVRDVVIVGIESAPGGTRAFKWVLGRWAGRWYYGPRQWRFWRRDAWAAPPELEERRREAERSYEGSRKRQAEPEVSSSGVSSAVAIRPSSYAQEVIYRRFLAGEVADDEDDEAVEWQRDDSDTDADGLTDDEWNREETPVPSGQLDLYADLVAEVRPQPEVLLAHLTSTSSSPLTRRRYAALMAPQSRGGLSDAIIARRETALASGYNRDEWDDDRRRCCVVCTIEPRDTILWPCRCLALCNECRENLAGRLSSDNHMCPCCRRKVEGFSRIYIP